MASRRTSKRIVYTPLANGLDYMKSAVDHLAGSPDERDLKYGVLHLAAAIEVLLKARLSQEHWTLILEDIDQVSLPKYQAGDFRSIAARTTMKRLETAAGLHFEDRDYSAVATIVQKRNRLQHHGLDDTVTAIQTSAAHALDFLLSFLHTELRSTDGGEDVDEALDDIRGSLSAIKRLVQARRESLTSTLDAIETIVRCPSCGEWGLEPGLSCRCHFCTEESDPDVAAEAYVDSVLGFGWRDLAKGGEPLLHSCPNCGIAALVEGAAVRGHEAERPSGGEPPFWVCFNECGAWGYSEIDRCARCGEPTVYGGDDGQPVCQECFAAVMASD